MDNIVDTYLNFLFYRTDDGAINVQVVVDRETETIWLSQKGMSELFCCSTDNISLHLRNIYQDGELQENRTTEYFSVVQSEGIRKINRKIKFYNLDAIIAVGYRVNSYQATQFRIWATKILKEYLIKGFVLDDERLKQGNRLFGKDHFKELLERIREIRASERMFYEKLSDILKDCSSDYDKDSPITREFYAKLQNKFHYAIHQHTAAELIAERVNADSPNMGLTSWSREKEQGKIYQSDALNAKNYLSHDELDGMNRLVNMYLDYAERFANQGIQFTMKEWVDRLDSFLQFYEYPILRNFGKIQKKIADKIAIEEYRKFRIKQDKEYKSDFNRFLDIQSIEDIPSEKVDSTKAEQRQFDLSLITALNYNPHKEEKKTIDDNDEF